MITTLLTLAVLTKGAEKPIVDPAPPAEFKRLQPRAVTASSILRDSFNRFEQNYLPVYVADDAPDTAWVEGVKGQGVGESLTWVGPPLQKAKALKIFIRNGLQASKKLFDANGRAKKIRLETVAPNPDGAGFHPAGTPLELELKSVEGWQEIDLPLDGAFSALKLTLLSTYKGTRYEDTCISDLRVYVNGEDPYKAEVEAKALENIKAFIASRAALKPQLASAYEGKLLAELPAGACTTIDTCLQELQKMPKLEAIATRAKKALDRVDGAGPDAAGWHFVEGRFGEKRNELNAVFSSLSNRRVTPSELLERRSISVSSVKPPKNKESLEYYDLAMVQGPYDNPTAVLIREGYEIDGRTSTSINQGPSYAVTYDGDVADAVVEFSDYGLAGSMYLVVWSPPSAGPLTLKSVVSIDVSEKPAVYEWKVKG
jgi:hypothetical protein